MKSRFPSPALLFAAGLALAAAACGRKEAPPPPSASGDPVAELVQRATAAPAAIEHARVEMNQVEITHILTAQNSLSAIDKKRLERYEREPQPDGSAVYSYRVHGVFEYRAPGLSWIRLQRSGGDDNANVIMSDGESSYYFNTRFPDTVSRTPARANDANAGLPALGWIGVALAEENKLATSRRLRGREVLDGELCDVIELTVPINKDDPQSTDRELVYYIAAADGLVRRSTETRGRPGRRTWSETTLDIDRAFVPEDINYVRFETEVMSLLKDKVMPPIVAKMQ